MGAPELHLSAAPSAAPSLRRFHVAGESMEFFLRSGDRLLVEVFKGRGGRAPGAGDLLLFIGCKGSALLLAHRVLGRLPWGDALFTKGDFHLLPDAPAARGSWLGVARIAERDGRRVFLDCPLARLAGVFLAAYSLPCVLVYRLAQLILWLLRRAASAGGDEDWARLAVLETWHLSALRPFLRALPDAAFAALAWRTERRYASELAALLGVSGEGEPARPLAGEIFGVRELSGEVRVCGDLVVLPGAELILRPGARLVFQEGKRLHHGIRRSWEGAAHDLTDPARPQAIVYGKLSVLGEPAAPVRFESAAGAELVFVGGGTRRLRHAEFSGVTLRLLDDSGVVAEGCRFSRGAGYAVWAGGRARAALRDCVFAGGWGGAAAHERAFVSLSRCSGEGPRTALFAKGEARLRVSATALRAAGAPGLREGLRLEERARARVRGLSVEGYPVGVLLRGGARGVLSGCRAGSNGLGVFVEQSARLLLRGSRITGSRTHGIWVKDRASVRAVGTVLARSAHNGVYVSDGGRFASERSAVSRNRTGVSLGDGGRARLTWCSVSGNREQGLHSAGGLLVLEECRLSGSREGILLTGDARASLAGGTVRGAARAGLLLRQESAASLEGVRLERNAAGIVVEDRGRAALRHGSVECSAAQGILLRGEASLVVDGTGLSGNGEAGLFAAEDSSARLADCRLQGHPGPAVSAIERAAVAASACSFEGNGVGWVAAEDAAVEMDGCELSSSRGHGLWLKGRAKAVLKGSAFRGNGENGVFLEGEASLRMKECRVAEHARAGFAMEGGARAEAEGGGFSGNGNGLLLSGRAELVLSGAEISGNRGHGAWLKGSAVSRWKGVVVRSNPDNGAYLEDAAALQAAGSSWEGGGCAVSTTGGSRADLSGCRFAGQTALAVSCAGPGERRLEACLLEDSPVGVSVLDGTLRLAESRFSGHVRAGLAASGGSVIEVRGCVFKRCGTGVAAGGAAALRLERCELRGSLGHGLRLTETAEARLVESVVHGSRDNGVYLSDRSVLEDSRSRFSGCGCGLAAEGDSRTVLHESRLEANTALNASLSGGRHQFEFCELSEAPVGLSLSGEVRAALRHCGVRRHSGEGLSASGESSVEVAGGSFEGNGTGLGVAEGARLDLEEVRVTGSARFGLWARDRGRAELVRCVFDGNDGAGVYAEGGPELAFRGGELRENRGHGCWATGGAAVRMTETRVRGNGENGLFAEGDARFLLSACEVSGNRCGAAAKGAARFRAVRCVFERQAALGLDFGGASRLFLSACEVRSTPQGLAVQGKASAATAGVRFTHLGRGVVLTGRARAVFRDSLWRANEVGLWCQEESSCRVRGGIFRGNSSEALRAGQTCRVEAFRARFSRNCMAVLLEDRSAALLRSCAFRLNPTGIKADGPCRLAVERCRLRGCVLDGVWIGRETDASVTGCDLRSNRIGLHHHYQAQPRLSVNTFLQNQFGDVRRFPEEAFS